MKHEFLDHHRRGNSLVHRLDPRVKLIMMFVFVLIAVITPWRFRGAFTVYGTVAVLMALLSGISFWHLLSKLLKLYPFIFFITFLLPFFPGSELPLLHIGVLNIYEAGLQKFLLINMKSILAIFMSIVLTTTTHFDMLLRGLEKLRLPRMVIAILSFMYRFLFLLIDETERMQMAYQSRHFSLPALKRIRFVGQMVGVLFIRTFERGERVYQAMDARGFNGTVHATTTLRWTLADSMMLSLFVLIIVLPLILLMLTT